MSSMASRTVIQERVTEAILDVAADLLARNGEPPSMADIAEAAGVARATLYRYFPTRERLLQSLSATGVEAAAARLAQADLDTVPVPEGIARLARVIAAAGSRYAVGAFDRDGAAEQQMGIMMRALLQRGIDDGTLRGDLTVDELGFALGHLLKAAARMTAQHQAGVEKAAALVTTVFLEGAQNRGGAAVRDHTVRHHSQTGEPERSNREDATSPDKAQG
jgi:TetR/AcrR family transcriptional regulator, mexCD-oprJ operon repressor